MPPFDPLLLSDSEAPSLNARDLLWSLGMALGLSALVFVLAGWWTGAQV